MDWRIEITAEARRQLRKIDRADAKRIRDDLRERLEVLDDPRQLGKLLKGRFSELWRYRIGEYRVICELQDRKLVILVIRIEHRKNVYR